MSVIGTGREPARWEIGSASSYSDGGARMQVAGWACDASCLANNPNSDLTEGLGEMEIKAEPIRFVAGAGNDLLADAAFNVESWLLEKYRRASAPRSATLPIR